MAWSSPRTLHPLWQYVLCLSGVAGLAGVFFFLSDFTGYRVVALVLLLCLSLLAMVFEIGPVLAAATLSALVWNFFFIPPLYTFHIGQTEDWLLFLLYFFVALVNTTLTYRIRKAEAQARDKAEKERSLALYRTVFHSLSHELRTPIANIVGAADTLQENEALLSTGQKLELVHQISDSGWRLSRQVDNLLHLSRLESGFLKAQLEWTDLEEWLPQVLEKTQGEGEQRVRLHIPSPMPLVKTDAGFLEPVLRNLLENARLYAPADSPIDVEVVLQNGGLRLRVSDQGPGIDPEHLPHVFEKFFRIPGTLPGGSGLGLSLVKGFTEALQGDVQVTSQTGRGSTFEVRIPVETTFVNHLHHD